MFERQLEDVSPADTAEVDLFSRAVGGTAQHQELRAKEQEDSEHWLNTADVMSERPSACYLHVINPVVAS